VVKNDKGEDTTMIYATMKVQKPLAIGSSWMFFSGITVFIIGLSFFVYLLMLRKLQRIQKQEQVLKYFEQVLKNEAK
jgi:hypothetical protein